MDSPIFWILAAVLVLALAGLWGLVWWKDSRRAEGVAHDSDRLRQGRRARRTRRPDNPPPM